MFQYIVTKHDTDMEQPLWFYTHTLYIVLTFVCRDNPKFISSVGRSLVNLIRVIPNGVLIFFPSYPLMQKFHQQWQNEGIWSNINDQKVGCIYYSYLSNFFKTSFSIVRISKEISAKKILKNLVLFFFFFKNALIVK